jgi:two-component system sensor histidine kinase SenX3
MRRPDQRRLEALLSRLAPPLATPAPDSGSLDALLRDIESAAGATGERAEQAERHNERLRAGLDTLSIGVVICDELGDEVYRNMAASRFGLAGMGDVLAEQAVSETIEGALGGASSERSLELFSPRRNLTVRAFPISSDDGPLGAVAVVEDVSERRRLDAIRRDFVANVSHELKTPVGALSLLAETLDGEDDPEIVARLSGRVATEAERLGRIIDDLLDLSRIEANDRPNFGRVGVGELLAEATELLRAVADGRDIKLDVDRPPAHLSVPGDRRDLVSAVSNLVDNAVKYSEPGSLVHVRVTAGADTVAIAVCDQGIGIPTRDLSRIFERFYRVDRARSRLTGGTGLGLSIVRHVAANHGGTVKVTSREGEGSTFTLELPVRPGAELRPVPPAAEGPVRPAAEVPPVQSQAELKEPTDG